MKKYLIGLLALPMLFWSCDADEGTEPGSDRTPNVVIYTYAPEDGSGLDADNDVTVRFATNSATSEVYYLSELESTAQAEIEANGEAAYIDKVIANGQKIDVDGAQNVEVSLTGMTANYLITAVAVNGNNRSPRMSVVFEGVAWKDVTTGTFYFRQSFIDIQSVETSLQVCETEPTLYRLKNVFGSGHSLKIVKLDTTAEDADGKFNLARIPLQATGLPYGRYEIAVEDIGYWQGNNAYCTDPTSWAINQFYEDNNLYLQICWGALSGGAWAGYLDYQSPSYFIPD